MKKQPKLGVVCSLVCAAGSLWLAIAELFDREADVLRRMVHVFFWLAACAVWTANLVLGLEANKTGLPETDDLTQIKEDNFDE